MANIAAEINAQLPDGAPHVRVGDRIEIVHIRLVAHLIGEVAELTRAVARLEAVISRG